MWCRTQRTSNGGSENWHQSVPNPHFSKEVWFVQNLLLGKVSLMKQVTHSAIQSTTYQEWLIRRTKYVSIKSGVCARTVNYSMLAGSEQGQRVDLHARIQKKCCVRCCRERRCSSPPGFTDRPEGVRHLVQNITISVTIKTTNQKCLSLHTIRLKNLWRGTSQYHPIQTRCVIK